MNVDQKVDSQQVNLDKFDEEGGSKRNLQGWNLKLAATVAISWSTFSIVVCFTFTLHFKLW